MKLRILKVAVQVVALADDGDTLSELDVTPLIVPWAKWSEWVAGGGLDMAVEHLRNQIEQPDESSPSTPV